MSGRLNQADEIARGNIDSRDATRIGVSQESPMPMSINDQYDHSQELYSVRNHYELEAEMHRQHKFAVERKEENDALRTENERLNRKLERIEIECLKLNNPGVNLAVHRVANTVLEIIRGTL